MSHSAPESDPSSPCRPPPEPRCRKVPASSALPALACPPVEPLRWIGSPPPPLPPDPWTPPALAAGVDANIPLQLPSTQYLVFTPEIVESIRMVSTCIDICMAMMAMYITSTETNMAHIAHIKELKRRDGDDVSIAGRNAPRRHAAEEAGLHHL